MKTPSEHAEKATYARDQMRRWRYIAVEALGGKCVVCGYDDPRALHIDHVNGGGAAERKAQRGIKYTKYVAANASSGKYQILCANHNFEKKADRNEVRQARGA